MMQQNENDIIINHFNMDAMLLHCKNAFFSKFYKDFENLQNNPLFLDKFGSYFLLRQLSILEWQRRFISTKTFEKRNENGS